VCIDRYRYGLQEIAPFEQIVVKNLAQSCGIIPKHRMALKGSSRTLSVLLEHLDAISLTFGLVSANAFQLEIFLETMSPTFPAIPRLLEPAEWRSKIRRTTIDMNLAGP